jgi:hypothetical protein
MINVQEEELKLRKNDAIANREKHKEEIWLQALERTRSTEVLKKSFASCALMQIQQRILQLRNAKLDECCDTLGRFVSDKAMAAQ